MLSESGVGPEELAKAAKFIAAGICMGIGGIGTALGQGFVGGKACEAIGRRPESVKSVFRTMSLAVVIAETSVIFAFVVALMLMFMV